MLLLYRDQQLDKINEALADAHLKLCVICGQRLTFLIEDKAALEKPQITDRDVAFVRRTIQETGPRRQSLNSKPLTASTVPSLEARLTANLLQLVASWRAIFISEPHLGSDARNEAWNWQSEDGSLKALAVLDKNSTLTLRLSSREPGWEGARLKFRLGPVNQEIIFQLDSDGQVHAQVGVPLPERSNNLTDMSIEVVAN